MTTEIDAEGLADLRSRIATGDPTRVRMDELLAVVDALASTSASEAEPVAWMAVTPDGDEHTTMIKALADGLVKSGWTITPLYAKPLPTPASDDQVEAVAMLAPVKEEAAKDNAPLGRSDSLALERIRSVLGLPSGGALAAMGSTKP